MQVGDQRTVERTFTREEVRAFSGLSGDVGSHHLRPNASGELMVHGLLVASLPTRIGGEMNFIARELTFEFLRPAYTGETLRCTVEVTSLNASGPTTHLEASWSCWNARGEVVMQGRGRGIIRDRPAGAG